MKTNVKKVEKLFTEEGGKAVSVCNFAKLKRAVLSTLLFEDNAYEDGQSITDRIKELIPTIEPEKVAALAIQARSEFKLRSIPLFLARELARHEKSRHVVANTLNEIIQRPDELGEFVSLYNLEKKQPLAKQVKLGLARAFTKFDEYALQKFNGGKPLYSLKDVLFLCHAKPVNKAQAKLWKKLINNELKTPDTWEVAISAAKDKKMEWERLLSENKLGALAVLRNLRNFKELGVDEDLIINAIENLNTQRVLPFRFISAARYYPSLEAQLETAMFKCLDGMDKLSGRTVILLDVSGSMKKQLSTKSDMTRQEAANALGILAREICKNVKVFTFSKKLVEIPNRRGFGLRDAINASQEHLDTYLGAAIKILNENEKFDRLICLTDEQSADDVPQPAGKNNYLINIANNKNGVGYRNGWTHIDGMSEGIFSYIEEIEKE